jgi:hypothetical protein
MITESLLDRTIQLLKARGETFKTIEANTGLKYEWIARFSQGRIPGPSVRKIQALHDYLASQQ